MRRPAVATTPNDVKIAAVGDSITYGLSTEEVVPYPEVLSQLLDDTFGAGHFAVTNLGYVRRSQRRAPHPHDTPPAAPSPLTPLSTPPHGAVLGRHSLIRCSQRCPH